MVESIVNIKLEGVRYMNKETKWREPDPVGDAVRYFTTPITGLKTLLGEDPMCDDSFREKHGIKGPKPRSNFIDKIT